MRYLGGHLGATVSALLDGQLDPASAERAWAHVRACALCDQLVTREGWVKTRLASMGDDEGPPAQLLGSLYGLGTQAPAPTSSVEAAHAWATVRHIEQRGRARRRAGLALAGAGSVSAAVLGLATLTGGTLGIGASPAGAPTTAFTGSRAPAPSTGATAVIAPLARVHGRVDLGGGPVRPPASDRVGPDDRGEGVRGLRQ